MMSIIITIITPTILKAFVEPYMLKHNNNILNNQTFININGQRQG